MYQRLAELKRASGRAVDGYNRSSSTTLCQCSTRDSLLTALEDSSPAPTGTVRHSHINRRVPSLPVRRSER
ncbi:hypothetical protein C8R45DRAFT_1114436 [Mycena sanguinolenta]|nr:hypothetical protein C8R45DRAFT_1114436 [Mycena sanguinolenta]